MPKLTRHAALAAVLASLVGATHAVAQGCAMCGTVLGANDPRANAFKWSILFLMAVPYVLAVAVAGWLYLSVRRGRAAARDGHLDLEGGGLTTDYNGVPVRNGRAGLKESLT
jgi:hypothetical protein